MEKKRALNVDLPGSISEFLGVMKEFRLKRDIYKILFRGKGLEFEAYRDFSPDDDASYIDWKASSRAQKLLVKQYKEERNLKVMFLIDVGDNMISGSAERLKCEYVTELVAAFSRLILDANDRVGFYLFSDRLKHFIQPKSGEKHFQFCMDLLSSAENYGGQTNIDGALDGAMKYLDHSINSVIIISDFLKVSRQTEKRINLISHSFETLVIRIRDLLDMTLPDINEEIVVTNPFGEQVVINPKIVRAEYELNAHEQAKYVEEFLKKSEADFLDLITKQRFAVPLALFLKERIANKL